MLLFESIDMVAGFSEPDRSPLQWSNAYPPSAMAVTVTSVPGAYPPVGSSGSTSTLPPSELLTNSSLQDGQSALAVPASTSTAASHSARTGISFLWFMFLFPMSSVCRSRLSAAGHVYLV